MLIINSKELVTLANRVDKIHRSDLPIAVRSTLNTMAFRMKAHEIERSAKNSFEYSRNKTLFKSLSRFDKSKGFNIKRMQSEAGIVERGGRQKVARGLASQERGGPIESKSVPTKASRGGNISAKVRASNRLSKVRIVDARKSKKNRFIAAAAVAKRNKTFLLVKTNNPSVDAVARVSRFNKRDRNKPVKLRWMYSIHDAGKRIEPSKSRRFIKKAYIQTMKGFHSEFIKQANRRIQKSLRK